MANNAKQIKIKEKMNSSYIYFTSKGLFKTFNYIVTEASSKIIIITIDGRKMMICPGTIINKVEVD